MRLWITIKMGILFLLTCLVLSSCEKDSDDCSHVELLTILPHKELTTTDPVLGRVEHFIAITGEGKRISILYIDGFDEIWEEGFYYKLKVKVEYYSGSSAEDDVSHNVYYLLEVIDKVKE